MNLPEEFTRRMKLLLEPEDFKAFIESYSDDKSYGLRINPLKIESQETLPFFLSPVPWAKEGFYAVPEEKPGRHALQFIDLKMPVHIYLIWDNLFETLRVFLHH